MEFDNKEIIKKIEKERGLNNMNEFSINKRGAMVLSQIFIMLIGIVAFAWMIGVKI
jgi:hypothetical protein